MRIVQITEQDKMELGELGHKAVESMHEFLECLDKVSGGQISQEMAERYGERRGVRGTGRYGRRDGGYGERDDYGERGYYGERRGVPGTGRYGRRDGGYGEHDDFGERGGGYNTRYDY